MQRSLVMTVIGRDRPGLVDSLAGLVAQYGGNWLESRMSRLGGQFAGILRVQVSREQEAGLVGSLTELQRDGLTVVVHSERPKFEELGGRAVLLEELDTECSSAAMSGETLFKARAKLNIPESCNLATLRLELEKIAEDLIVDLRLKELPTEPVKVSSAGSGNPTQSRPV